MDPEPEMSTLKDVLRLSTARERTLQNALEAVAEFAKAFKSGDLVIYEMPGNGGKSTSSASVLSLRRRMDRGPLETLDTLAIRLNTLMTAHTHMADDLQPISDEIIGLRADIADLFEELKDGNIAAATAHTVEVESSDATRAQVNARLDHLEKREEQDSS